MAVASEDHPRTDARRAHLSLAVKVPLVAAFLIVLIGTAISMAAYLEARHTVREQARVHIGELVTLVSQQVRSGVQLTGAVRTMAARKPVTEFVANPTPDNRVAALSSLLTRGAGGPTLLAIEIRNARGDLLLTTNTSMPAAQGDFPAVIAANDSGSVGRLRVIRGSIVYPVAARLPGLSGAYMVQWRHATSNAKAIEQMKQLMGVNATILMGNSDGSYWTDLANVVPAPPVDLHKKTDLVSYKRAGETSSSLAGIVPYEGTPWSVAIEFPEDEVMAPTQKFLRAILIITLACVGIGMIAAWAFARQLTEPLQILTAAAQDVAAGRPATVDLNTRTDELGVLGRSFVQMSNQITDARTRLEEKVDERTSELNAAMRALQDAQDAMLRREKLAMLGQLAGSVGHELRNPLGVMNNAIFYLDMVLHDSPENVREYLKLLREQVTLSTRIVSDLLDLARIAPPQRRVVALREIVEAQLARTQIPQGVTVDLRVDGAMVEVDPLQVGQIVLNLLTNAVQAIDGAAGRITITAAPAGDRQFALSIVDTGPGIAAENIGKIFEPLFTTKARGIGLGLAVSRQLARANQGDIVVEQSRGAGAHFTVSLPAAVAVLA